MEHIKSIKVKFENSKSKALEKAKGGKKDSQHSKFLKGEAKNYLGENKWEEKNRHADHLARTSDRLRKARERFN